MPIANLFTNATAPASGERFDVLLKHQNLVIERIVSSSDITPTCYVQEQDEWVLLVQGRAVLDVDGVRHELHSGDYLFIPARVPHTVLQTTQGTVWLTMHLHQPRGAPAVS